MVIFLFSFLDQIYFLDQETADLVTFIEEILNGKLHFLCSDVPTIFWFDSNSQLIKVTLIKIWKSSDIFVFS